MQDAEATAVIRAKYIELLDDLDERGRRRWAAVEARALGRGGIATVAQATGLSDRTIRTGMKELDELQPGSQSQVTRGQAACPPRRPVWPQRRAGGGPQAPRRAGHLGGYQE